jgi:hypothetical protein
MTAKEIVIMKLHHKILLGIVVAASDLLRETREGSPNLKKLLEASSYSCRVEEAKYEGASDVLISVFGKRSDSEKVHQIIIAGS